MEIYWIKKKMKTISKQRYWNLEVWMLTIEMETLTSKL